MISECTSYVSSPSVGISMMENVDVAGVVCQLPSPATSHLKTSKGSSTSQSPTPVVVSDGQQQTSTSQQMMVLQSSVVTAAFMGVIVLGLLLLLGR